MSHISPRFHDALHYASRLHAADMRKGTEIPYVSHLLAVCGLVLEHGGTEDEAIAALLHDAIEDADDVEEAAARCREIARAVLRDYRELGEELWGRFNGGRDGTLWYYGTLAGVYRGRVPQSLADELTRTVADIARAAEG